MDQLIELTHRMPVNFVAPGPAPRVEDLLIGLMTPKRGELTVRVLKERPAGGNVSFRSQCDGCQCRVNNPAGWCFKFTDAPEGLCFEQEPRT